MIHVNYEQDTDQIEVTFVDVTSINFILSLYPNRNLKFMSGPVGLDTEGNSIEALSLKSRHIPVELPLVDEKNINELSSNVKSVIDEFFEFVGEDKEVYLYSVILSHHGCKVRGYFSR